MRRLPIAFALAALLALPGLASSQEDEAPAYGLPLPSPEAKAQLKPGAQRMEPFIRLKRPVRDELPEPGGRFELNIEDDKSLILEIPEGGVRTSTDGGSTWIEAEYGDVG